MADAAVDPPPPWWCWEDRLTAFLEDHPDFDLDDAQYALIWGTEDEDENQRHD